MPTNYCCSKCGVGGFANRQSLTQHVCGDVSEKDAKKLSCSVCPFTTDRPNKLATHENNKKCAALLKQKREEGVGVGSQTPGQTALVATNCQASRLEKKREDGVGVGSQTPGQTALVATNCQESTVSSLPPDDCCDDEFVDASDVNLGSRSVTTFDHMKEDSSDQITESQTKVKPPDKDTSALVDGGSGTSRGRATNRARASAPLLTINRTQRRPQRDLGRSRYFEPLKGKRWHELSMRKMGKLHLEKDYDEVNDVRLAVTKQPWDPDTDVPGQKQTIGMDGNCLFNAISWCVARDEKYHDRIRKHVMKAMVTEPLKSRLRGYSGKSEADYKEYVDKMSGDGVWGTDVELLAIAEMLDVPIWTFLVVPGEKPRWIPYVGLASTKSLDCPAIYLSNENNHYEVVLSVKTDEKLLAEKRVMKRKRKTPFAPIDLVSPNRSVCAKKKNIGDFESPKQTTDSRQEEEISSSMKKVQIGPHSEKSSTTVRSPFKSVGGALSNISGLFGNAVKVVRSIFQSEEPSSVSGGHISSPKLSGDSEQLVDDTSPTSPLLKFVNPPSKQARSSKSTGERKSCVARKTGSQFKWRNYRLRHPNSIEKRNKMYDETYGTARKARDFFRHANKSLRQRIRDAQKMANSRRQRTICSVAHSPALRRELRKQRRRNDRIRARKFLKHVRLSGKAEKKVVGRITNLIIATQRRQFRQQWNELHGGDEDCPMTVNDPRMRWKMRVDRMRAIPLVQSRVLKAKEYRRLAWTILCRHLAAFKKWFQKTEKFIAEMERAGIYRKAAIERAYKDNPYHVKSHDTPKSQRLKKYINQLMPFMSDLSLKDEQPKLPSSHEAAEEDRQNADSPAEVAMDIDCAPDSNEKAQPQSTNRDAASLNESQERVVPTPAFGNNVPPDAANFSSSFLRGDGGSNVDGQLVPLSYSSDEEDDSFGASSMGSAAADRRVPTPIPRLHAVTVPTQPTSTSPIGKKVRIGETPTKTGDVQLPQDVEMTDDVDTSDHVLVGLATPTKVADESALEAVSRSVQKMTIGASTSCSPDGGDAVTSGGGVCDRAVEEGGSRRVLARPCDSDCKLPSYWAVRLRAGLKKIVGSFSSIDTDYSLVLETLLETFSACPGCDISDPFKPCRNSSSFGCYDCVRLLRQVEHCSPVLRTIKRRYEEMVQLATYIVHVDRSFSRANLRYLSKVLVTDNMPRQLRLEIAEMGKPNVKLDRVNVEADAYASYGRHIDKFRADIVQFPVEICSVCMRIMSSKTDATKAGKSGVGNKLKSKEAFLHLFGDHPQLGELAALLPDDEQLTLCHTCRGDLRENQVPRFSTLNNMHVDEIPPEIGQLNTFERLLIQRAKAFLAVVKLKTVTTSKAASGHLLSAMKGNAVHLPLSMEATLEHINDNTMVLPMAGSLQVVVESKQVVNSATVRQSMVDMHKVTAALIKLKEINPLYGDIRIAGVDTADASSNGDSVDVTQAEQCKSVVLQKDGDPSLTVSHVTVEELLTSEHRSVIKMYDSASLQSDCEHFKGQQITNAPIPDQELKTDLFCFPRLFPRGRGGMNDDRPRKLSPSDYMKARLLHISQRFRRDPQYLFFLTALSVMREVRQGIFACTKTGKKGIKTTVKEFMDKCRVLDDEMELRLSQVFQHVRQSSAYWSQKRSDLRCYDEKFGPATFFITLSCAEYDWPDMKEYLKYMDELTEKHANSGGQAATIGNVISSRSLPEATSRKTTRTCDDPVAVMEHFQRRFDAVFSDLIAAKDGTGPFGKVEHYFWRVEYQMRGAPHVHMKIWIKDAPVIGIQTNEEVAEFLKGKVTCALPDKMMSPELHDLVTKYQCHNRCNQSCLRFDKKSGYKRCRYGFPRPTRSSMVINTSELTTKSGSRWTRIVELPRSDEERRINDYNPALLLAWRANIDVQFVGESSFVLNNYITNYISKKEKTAAREVWEQLDKSKGLYGCLLSLARQLERTREYGLFECAARLLGQHCFGRSVAVDFLGVGFKDKRRGKLRPTTVLQQLADDSPESTEIFHANFLDDYYPSRPDVLEDQSLFEVFAHYKFVPNRGPSQKKSPNMLPLKNDLGYLQRRSERVVKTPMFKPKDQQSTEQYFQLLLMLFRPWRDEVDDLLGGCTTYREAFESLKGSNVFDMATKYAEGRNRIDEAYELVEKWQNEKAADDEGINVAELFDEVEDDPTGTCAAVSSSVPPTPSVKVACRSQLNDCQKGIYDEVMTAIEQGEQIYRMISGVAGTGKSFLIDCIVSALKDRYGTESGPVAVITAPTGIAAFNVGGTTIHGTYKVPVRTSRSGHGYAPLHRDDVKHLRVRWKNARLFIVDEISMVSNTTLRVIHMRLAEVFGDSGSTKLFGGKNVLLFGDLLQLKPVKADFCFASTASHPSFTSHLCPGVWTGGELGYSELTENMRQKDDGVYADLLSRIRVGCPTDEDIAILKDRIMLPRKATDAATDAGRQAKATDETIISYSPTASAGADGKDAKKKKGGALYSDVAQKLEENGKKGLNSICLMPYSAQVAAFNDYMLHKTCSDIVSISAVDANISSKRSKRPAKAANVKSRKKRAADTGGLEDELILAKGACVMLRRNIDVESGLVNGAVGKVVDILRRDNVVSTIKVLFTETAGPVDIERITVEYEVGNKIWNERTQFPLTLAWAMTIHKSQGVSVDSAVIDLDAFCFEPGMAYVALSRVRKLENLHLVSFDPAVLDCHAIAVREYSRLRQLATPPLSAITEVNTIKERHARRKYRVTVTRPLGDPEPDGDCAPTPPKQKKANKQTYAPVFSQVALENETRDRCFANAVLVCLNNLHELYTATDSSPLYVELKRIKAKSVNSARHLIDILNNLLEPHIRFVSGRQHDAGEFLMKILDQLPDCRRQMFDYVRVIRRRCRNCDGVVSEQMLPESYLILPFTEATANSTFQEALDRSNNSSTAQLRCPDCEQLTTQDAEEELICGQEFLIVQLNLFVASGTPVVSKRITKRGIRGFDAASMRIGGSDYRTVGVVLHDGNSVHSGHYTAMCRSVCSPWQLICDISGTQPKDRFVSLLRNCYLLIMKKI